MRSIVKTYLQKWGSQMFQQISMFDNDSLTWFQENLLRGSGFANGKIRIFAAVLNLAMSELANFLKEEYGIGGCSIEGGFMDYNAKGIQLKKWKEEKIEVHSWAETAKEIKKLISMDLYLNNKEKETIKTIQANHDGKLPLPIARFKYN